MLYNKYNFLIGKFASKDEYPRPEISGVFITPKETVATDSFKLIRVERAKGDIKDYPLLPSGKHSKEDFKPFILPVKATGKIAAELAKIKSTLPIVSNAIITQRKKESIEISYTDIEIANSINSKIIEGEYPDYKSILKKEGKYTRIAVNVKMLKDIADFLNSFVDNRIKRIEIEIPRDEERPIFFEAKRDNGQKAEALLMPMKKD